ASGATPPAPAPETLPQPGNQGHYPHGDQPSGYAGQAGGWEGYVQAPQAGHAAYGCETGDCNTGAYNADCDYGNFGGGGHVLGQGVLGGGKNCRQWFFGAYSLFMSRDNPSYQRYAVLVDMPASYPYYPSQSETILSSHDIEPDWQWGAEVRFGSTFGTPC